MNDRIPVSKIEVPAAKTVVDVIILGIRGVMVEVIHPSKSDILKIGSTSQRTEIGTKNRNLGEEVLNVDRISSIVVGIC